MGDTGGKCVGEESAVQQWEYCYATKPVITGELRLEVRLCTLEGERVIQTFPFTSFGDPLVTAEAKRLAWLGLHGWEACGSLESTPPHYFKRPMQG